MPWYAIVQTNVALARILGVSQPAIVKAEQIGKIVRESDGTWDVFKVVDDWRDGTCSALQRRAGTFRPWLDAETDLTPYIRHELERRARAEGADVFWEDDADERDQDEAP
jgi:hypothetical protein